MLSFTTDAINDWLLRQPGGRHALERGLGSDDTPKVMFDLERLASALEDTKQDNPQHFEKLLTDPAFLSAVRMLAAHLGLARQHRLIGWIDEAGADCGVPVLRSLLDPQTPPTGSGTTLAVNIQRQHRLSLLDTIFAPERIARVLAACQRGID